MSAAGQRCSRISRKRRDPRSSPQRFEDRQSHGQAVEDAAGDEPLFEEACSPTPRGKRQGFALNILMGGECTAHDYYKAKTRTGTRDIWDS